MSAATPEALDALIAPSRQTRRETLLRGARREKMRTRFAYGCSGCIALLALAAFFLARDPDAGATLVMMALVTLIFAYLAGKSGQKKLADSLQEMDKSNPN
jgi:peptidoglycan/LPS O-acetylase OafA/YrhL